MNNFQYFVIAAVYEVFIPFPCCVFFYLKNFFKVLSSKRKSKGSLSPNDIKMLRSILIVFLAYLLTKLPEGVVVTEHLHWISWPQSFSTFAFIMFEVNAAVNAIIIGITNPDFKPFFLKVITCGYKGKARVQPKENAIRGIKNVKFTKKTSTINIGEGNDYANNVTRRNETYVQPEVKAN